MLEDSESGRLETGAMGIPCCDPRRHAGAGHHGGERSICGCGGGSSHRANSSVLNSVLLRPKSTKVFKLKMLRRDNFALAQDYFSGMLLAPFLQKAYWSQQRYRLGGNIMSIIGWI